MISGTVDYYPKTARALPSRSHCRDPARSFTALKVIVKYLLMVLMASTRFVRRNSAILLAFRTSIHTVAAFRAMDRITNAESLLRAPYVWQQQCQCTSLGTRLQKCCPKTHRTTSTSPKYLIENSMTMLMRSGPKTNPCRILHDISRQPRPVLLV